MHPLSIIVAEDDLHMRELVLSVLERLGARMRQAVDGLELLELLESGDPVDLVISDMRMPRASGLDALIRARAAGFEVPFLFVTASSPAETSAAARLGAVILRKPVASDDLLACVRRLCRRPGDATP